MTKLNIQNNNQGYTDGSVEIKLKELLEKGQTPEEILENDSSWEAVYHLSHERENILSWFPFKKDSRILEVGSGCGALTKILSEKAKEVVSVELTKNRAEVNYARNPNLDNVEIIAGNFNDLKFDQKFDYIILNGVLEYAGSFTNSIHPYEDFLKKLKDLLTEDGAIITAIENRIGLKYLNGAPEDHTGRLFSGINNYPGITSVRTFTKKELTELFEDVGFKYLEFFYPYPDYKLPGLILSDKSLGLINSDEATKSYNSNRLQFYDDIKMTTTLLQEGILDEFMNSFLVIASNKEQNIKTEYVKFPRNRQKKFSLVTEIIDDDKKVVTKKPEFEEGIEYINKIYKNYQNYKDNNFTLVPTERDGDTLIFDFLEGDTLEEYLINLLESGNRKGFEESILKFKDYLFENTEISKDFYTPEFKEIFGNKELRNPFHVKKNSNLDMIFSNVINDDEKHVIDYEWILGPAIPQEYVLFRSLFYLYYQNHRIRDLISLNELFDIINRDEEIITRDMVPVFKDWDEHFGNVYVSSGKSLPVFKTLDVSETLRQMYEGKDRVSSLYVDLGDGYKEETRVKAPLDISNSHFNVTFDLSHLNEPIFNLRWDPLESPIMLNDVKVESDKGELIMIPGDVLEYDNKYLFPENDPFVTIRGDLDNIKKITITGEIESLQDSDLNQIVKDLGEELKASKERIEVLERLDKANKFLQIVLNDEISDLGGEYGTRL